MAESKCCCSAVTERRCEKEICDSHQSFPMRPNKNKPTKGHLPPAAIYFTSTELQKIVYASLRSKGNDLTSFAI